MSNICWLNDPQLFLYAKGTGTGPDDVLLRRCKKPVSSSSSSLVVPMKSDDFDCVRNVENYRELIGNRFEWDETDYKRLVKYIYERLLLVNGQGLVIAEIYKLDDPNEVPIYIRSLDVLPLKPYIPHLMEWPIPLRTVKYLEDVNGKAAMLEEKQDSNVTKLTARVADLESENKTLDTNVTKLTARVAKLETENARLESKNNTLDNNVKKLTADMVTQMNALATLQIELNRILENPNYKEVWMNDLTNSDWVSSEQLAHDPTEYDNVIVVKPPGTFTVDDVTTNVRAKYWCRVQFSKNGVINNAFARKAIFLEDLIPNKEKARFLNTPCGWGWNIKCQGKTFIIPRSDV